MGANRGGKCFARAPKRWDLPSRPKATQCSLDTAILGAKCWSTRPCWESIAAAPRASNSPVSRRRRRHAWRARRQGSTCARRNSKPGMPLALAKDENLSPGGRGLEPLLDLRDVKGPLVCCASPANGQCVSNWPVTCAVLGACDGGAATVADACASDAQTPPIGDADLPDTAAPRDDDGAVASSKDPNDGCSCRMGAEHSASDAWFAAMLTAFSVAVQRHLARGGRGALLRVQIPPPRPITLTAPRPPRPSAATESARGCRCQSRFRFPRFPRELR